MSLADIYEEKKADMFMALVDEIREITGDSLWLDGDYDASGYALESLVDMCDWYLSGEGVPYRGYYANEIHPELNADLLELAVKNVIERLGN